jgi:hypothetical protein
LCLQQGLKVRAIGLGPLEASMVRRSRDDQQALRGEFLPPLHRTESDNVMFRREQ